MQNEYAPKNPPLIKKYFIHIFPSGKGGIVGKTVNMV